MAESHYKRCFLLALCGALLSLPFLIYGAVQCVSAMHTAPLYWLPETVKARRDYQWFMENFEREAIIVVSWDGCTLDDPRLDALSERLAAADDPRDPLFERVVTGRGALAELTVEPLELDRDAAIDRLLGTLVGPDRKTTCGIAVLSDRGAAQRNDSIERIRQAALDCEIPEEDIHLAGPPVEGANIDAASERALYYFTLPSFLVSLVLCWWCIRSWPHTLAVLAVAAVGQLAVLAAIHYSGAQMNAVLIVLPGLLFVLTVSAGVHLANYHIDEVRTRGVEGSTRRAMASGCKPCLLALATTVVGLASLLVSDLRPIRQFGLFSSLGLILSVGLLLLTLPGVMEIWPGGRAAEEQHTHPRAVLEKTRGFWILVYNFVHRNWAAVLVANVGLLVLGGAGLIWLKTSVDVRSLMAPQSDVVQDIAWLEDNIASVVPVEVVVRFDERVLYDYDDEARAANDHNWKLIDRLELMHDVEAKLARVEGVAGTTSALTFAPPLEFPRRAVSRSVRDSVMREEGLLEKLAASPYMSGAEGGEAWRISVRASVPKDHDYAALIETLDVAVQTAMQEHGTRGLDGVTSMYTGGLPVADMAHRTLLRDLLVSFLVAFGFVAVVMIFVLRSVLAGLLAMLPNIFPTAVTFGLMGWIAHPIDVGTVMTASVALGIAVDDSLHLLIWFRREAKGEVTRGEAVWLSFLHCGRAMVQTTLICGLGLLVFALSDFVPTQRFAWMMLVLLCGALVGDLLLLPALLISRAGRLFMAGPC